MQCDKPKEKKFLIFIIGFNERVIVFMTFEKDLQAKKADALTAYKAAKADFLESVTSENIKGNFEKYKINFTVKKFDEIISKRKKRTYARRTAAELEQIKAEKEKDILLTERSKEIYRKLYIIYIYKSDLKTFKGLINRFLNDKINIEKDFAESVEIARQKEEHRIKCWQGDANDWHNKEGIVDLYYKDISVYVLKMRGIKDCDMNKKFLKQIKTKLAN